MIMKSLIERIGDLLAATDISIETLKDRLKSILSKMLDSIGVNISSDMLVSFLADDFLDLTQLRTGNFRCVESIFQLSKPIHEVIEILQFKAAHKMIELSTSFLSGEANRLIRCDKRRIMQVMLNLLSNAVKFTPNNGHINVQVRIIKNNDKIHAELAQYRCDADELLEVTVTDNGTGIKESNMA